MFNLIVLCNTLSKTFGSDERSMLKHCNCIRKGFLDKFSPYLLSAIYYAVTVNFSWGFITIIFTTRPFIHISWLYIIIDIVFDGVFFVINGFIFLFIIGRVMLCIKVFICLIWLYMFWGINCNFWFWACSVQDR